MIGTLPEHHPDTARRADGLLAQFNAAGVLTAADVHVASTLGRLGGETDQVVLLAAALVVRSTRQGSVVVDLATAAETTSPDSEETGVLLEPIPLPWPDPADWVTRCAASPLVAGEEDPPGRPLRLVGTSMWLDRYFGQEREVADGLLSRAAAAAPDLDEARLAAGLARLFGAEADADQRAAAEQAVRSRLAVIVGGPGTGKTTTVARLLALLHDQPGPTPRIALAAPTGKAAARLTEAVRGAVAGFGEDDRSRVGEPAATTVHRLLGFRPGSRSRFSHDRDNRLPHDVVIVDETSMVSLTLMARLIEAVRPTARLVLVGDADQLASVEAGAVLGDLTADPESSALGGHVVRLRRTRRFHEHGEIAALAAAVRRGDAQATLDALRDGAGTVAFVEVADDADLPEAVLADLRADVLTTGAAMFDAATAGDGAAALAAADAHRVLCAHRLGPRGVRHWTARVSGWLTEAGRVAAHRVGEPLLITENDADLGLFNGDTGVVVATEDGPRVAFRRGNAVRLVPLGRLPAHRPVHAMTVHRAQGSEFASVSVLLPAASSPLATRQTLYTAITRATDSVRLIGSADAVARAVQHPAARASGLGARLRLH
ncbi:MAG TPA: exodeoxyribonuclease V subunit alpha [Sporichthyaceae bacterium]|jgi:exodeoxyribonuclease V alpha subunit